MMKNDVHSVRNRSKYSQNSTIFIFCPNKNLAIIGRFLWILVKYKHFVKCRERIVLA